MNTKMQKGNLAGRKRNESGDRPPSGCYGFCPGIYPISACANLAATREPYRKRKTLRPDRGQQHMGDIPRSFAHAQIPSPVPAELPRKSIPH